MGTRERLLMEHIHVHERGSGRVPRDSAVVARERLPVGREDVYESGKGRAPRSVAVVARVWLSMGPVDAPCCDRAHT